MQTKPRKSSRKKVVILRYNDKIDEYQAVAYEGDLLRTYYNDVYDARLPKGIPLLTRQKEAKDWLHENPMEWLQVTKAIARKLGYERFSDEEREKQRGDENVSNG